MNVTVIVRVAKICALLGFFLPWALVSCSGQTIASVSGMSLAMGDMAVHNPVNGTIVHQHSSPNLFLLLALVALVAGLAFSFGANDRQDPRRTPRIQLISAGAALALCLLGIMTLYSGRDQAIAKIESDNQLAAGVASMVDVKTQFGFWLTILALATAAGASGLVVTGREALLENLGAQARRVGGGAPGDDDERFWDHIPDKNDTNALEEYLLRFPQGRFVSLARVRLERAGLAPVEPDPAATAANDPVVEQAEPAETPPAVKAPLTACPTCAAPLTQGARFCSACGASVAA